MENVIQLLTDDDQQVRQNISHVFSGLKSRHFFSLRPFLDAFAASSGTLEDMFTEYLWEHGLLDPDWTLSTVKTIINTVQQQPAQKWRSEAEGLIRLVLRIHTEPTSDENLQKEAMDVFDSLMEHYSRYALKILSEWDQR